MNELGLSINPFMLPFVELDDHVLLPSKPGLYFVIDGDRILYIGKSQNLRIRWSAHHRYKQIKKIAKSPVITFLDVKSVDLLHVERHLIKRFNPMLNDEPVLKTGKPKPARKAVKPKPSHKGRQPFNGYAEWDDEPVAEEKPVQIPETVEQPVIEDAKTVNGFEPLLTKLYYDQLSKGVIDNVKQIRSQQIKQTVNDIVWYSNLSLIGLLAGFFTGGLMLIASIAFKPSQPPETPTQQQIQNTDNFTGGIKW